MKIIASLLFVSALAAWCIPTLVSTDDQVIERALNIDRKGFRDTLLIPVQFARIKIALSNEKKCVLSDGFDPKGKRAINYIVAAFGMDGIDDEYVKKLISAYVKSGCGINELDVTGLTPLHDAILFGQPALVSFLLEHGSDSSVKANLKNNGPTDAIEFARLLKNKTGNSIHNEILETIEAQSESGKSFEETVIRVTP